MKNNLIGKTITFYMDGGWETSGVVKTIDEEKVVIENNKDLYVVIRSKVSCFKMTENERKIEQADAPAAPLTPVRVPPKETDVDSDFPMNRISYEDSSLSIPRSILGNPDIKEDDFSISFSEEKTNSKIVFRVEDDS
jgi:hypothetical protein